MRRLLPLATGLAVVALLAQGPTVVSSASATSASATSAPAPARSAVGGALLSTPGVHVQAKPGLAVKPLPAVDASSWLIADATTGEILAAKNAHEQRRPASTLKTLTAVTLLPRLNPSDTYTPVYEDITAQGSKVGIVNGSTYTIEQLWYGLFLASGNDTAHALARANGGLAKTVAEMNVEAQRLQAYDTVAKTPSGLDHAGQHSSAYDLALISRAGLAMPDFAKYCSTVSVTFPREGKKAKRKTFMVYNHNPLLLGGYPGAIGVKTGYTVLAGRTFVGAAKRGNRTVLITLMNYNGNTYRTAESLLNWGFKNALNAQAVGTLVNPIPAGTSPDGRVKNAASTSKSPNASHGGSRMPPLWPFVLIPLIALAAWPLRSRIRLPESDPLAAANKGLGRSKTSAGPRGRSGPGRY